jgi:hypothetical protein
MTRNNERLAHYFRSLVDAFFKILPLYEEENEGLEVYLDMLIADLQALDDLVDAKDVHYSTIISRLKTIKTEIAKEDSEHAVVKRCSFSCCTLAKKMAQKIEGE